MFDARLEISKSSTQSLLAMRPKLNLPSPDNGLSALELALFFKKVQEQRACEMEREYLIDVLPSTEDQLGYPIVLKGANSVLMAALLAKALSDLAVEYERYALHDVLNDVLCSCRVHEIESWLDSNLAFAMKTLLRADIEKDSHPSTSIVVWHQ